MEHFHFIGIVMIVMMERFKHKMLTSGKDYLVMFAYFSSVFFHELAHYLVSLLMGGKPTRMTIIPIKNEIEENGRVYHKWELGNVVSTDVNFFNALPIGIAPLFLLIGAYYIFKSYFYFFDAGNGQQILLFYFLLYLFISNSLPSKEDFKIALMGTFSLPFYLSMCILAYFNKDFILGGFNEIKNVISIYIN